jgi:FkbM family methyltransferase
MKILTSLRKTGRKIFIRGPQFLLRFVTRQNTYQMWGRVFDLRKKQLIRLDGFSLFVMPNDYIGRSIRETRIYEPHVTSVIRSTLKEGDVFLDVGANIGYFTLLASSIVKESGRVIAFEPNPQNLQMIYSSILEARARNISVFPYAASDAAAILRFTTVGSNGGVVTDHSKDQGHYLMVPAVVLDEALRDEERIDLVKIDIEAHEPAAVRGMERLIRRLRPTLITEFHPWAMKLNNPDPPVNYLHQLMSLDYELSIIETSGKCLPVADVEAVWKYWHSLGRETAHLDLLARPLVGKPI